MKNKVKYLYQLVCKAGMSTKTARKVSVTRLAPQVFVPYDLRRSIATGTRSTLGKEAAKLLLGHTKTDTMDN